MKTKITFGALFACLIAFSSCEKQESDFIKVNHEQEISVKNGMLAFKSREFFLSQMAEWNKLDLESLDKAVSAYKFQSYALDTLSEREDDVTPDPLLQRVLNEKAAIRVGDSIFVVIKGAEIIIKGSSIDTYKSVVAGNLEGDDVEILPTQYSVAESIIDMDSSREAMNIVPFHLTPDTWYGETQIFSPEEYFGRQERIKLVIFAQTGALNPNCGATVRGEAFRTNGWLTKKRWHDDEIAALTFTLSSMVMNDGQTVTNQPPVTAIEKAVTKLIYGSSGTHPGTGAHIGFKQLNFTLAFKKKNNPGSQTRSLTYRIINGIEQPLIKSW